MAGPITISVIGDTRPLVNGLEAANRGLNRTGKIAAGAGKAIAGGLAVGAVALVGLGAASVKSASNAQQSLGATETVFGKYADTVIKRSNEAATALGLSANEYRELSNVTGALLAGAGVPLKQVAGLTGELNTRAADMAATFGGTTKDAVEAISSLLKGEADPIEKYGVSIKQSDVNARLAAQGLGKLTGSALKQAEMQARLDLLTQKTSKTQGAFARESGTLANQQQKAGAQFENLKATLGTALLPVLTRVLTFVNANVIPGLSRLAVVVGPKLGPALTAAGGFFTRLGAGIASVLPQVLDVATSVAGVLGPALVALAPHVVGLVTSIAGYLGPILASLVPLVRSLAAVFVAEVLPAVQTAGAYFTTTVVPILAAVANVVVTQLLPTMRSFAQFVITELVPVVVGIYTSIGAKLRPILDQLAATFRAQVLPAVQKIIGKFEEWRPTIQAVILVVAKVIGKVLEFAAAVLGKVLPPLIRFAGFLLGTAVPAVLSVIGVIVKVIAKAVEFGAAFVKTLTAIGKWVTGVKDKGAEVLRYIGSIPGKVTDAIGDLGGLLRDAGVKIIQGLLDGIESMIGKVTDKLRGLTDLIPKVKGPPKRDAVLLRSAGRSIIQGLIDGFDDRYSAVRVKLGKLTDLIGRQVDTRVAEAKEDLEAVKRIKNVSKARVQAAKDAVAAATKQAKATKAAAGAAAKAIDRELDKVDRAYAAFAKLKKARADYIENVRAAAAATANITQVGAVGQDGEQTSASIIQGLRDRLNAITEFNAKVKALAKAGLRKDLLEQIIAAGVDGGTATAEALLAGGSQAVRSANYVQGQIAQATKDLGLTAANSVLAPLDRDKVTEAANRAAKIIARILRTRLALRVDVGSTRAARSSARTPVRTGATASSRRTAVNPDATASRSRPLEVRVKLTAEQLSRAQRGKEITLDIRAYRKAGGSTP